MSATPDRRIVLTFIGNYLPGFNAGGILRSLVNMIDHLGDEFDFRVVTRDRDIGDDRPYGTVRIGEWQRVGNASVYYLPPEQVAPRGLQAVINGAPRSTVYLISFFEKLTVLVLLLRLGGRIRPEHVIVAPRGEFGWGSLKLKYPKKLAFILLSRAVGLYRGVTWHASTAEEASDIARIMKAPRESIHVALDLPARVSDADLPAGVEAETPAELRIAFLSRIAREKNLDYALKVLRDVRSRVVFDIYGPAEDAGYWAECQKLMAALPANVVATYRGGVSPAEVVTVFGRYDLFFMPTSGENYGHVIAESLTAGTPVLISTETPWRGLQDAGLGWDIPLDRPAAFVSAIESMAAADRDALRAERPVIRRKAAERLTDPAVVEASRRLFRPPAVPDSTHQGISAAPRRADSTFGANT